MKLKRLTNNRGVALITAYVVISTLITLSIGFTLSAVNELAHARRYHSGAKAFWLSEGGIHQFLQDTTMLDNGQEGVTCGNLQACTKTITIGEDSVFLAKDDGEVRTVTATANVGGVQRQIEIEFAATPPQAFSSTLASGGDLHFEGMGTTIWILWWQLELPATMKVWGDTRLSGSYIETGEIKQSWFENPVQEGVDLSTTTLVYPDGPTDENSTGDEFTDFVDYYQNLAATYPEDEVAYFTPADGETLHIWPHGNSGEGFESLVGKKIVFVEGSTPGEGDVNIYFNSNDWVDGENLTIISTGTITYIEPLQVATDSKMNTVSWDNYTEVSLFLGKHQGTVYAHDTVDYYDLLDLSRTQGNVIGNNGINVTEEVAYKEFRYTDPIVDGIVPPGFEGLLGQGGIAGGYEETPSSWKET